MRSRSLRSKTDQFSDTKVSNIADKGNEATKRQSRSRTRSGKDRNRAKSQTIDDAGRKTLRSRQKPEVSGTKHVLGNQKGTTKKTDLPLKAADVAPSEKLTKNQENDLMNCSVVLEALPDEPIKQKTSHSLRNAAKVVLEPTETPKTRNKSEKSANEEPESVQRSSRSRKRADSRLIEPSSEKSRRIRKNQTQQTDSSGTRRLKPSKSSTTEDLKTGTDVDMRRNSKRFAGVSPEILELPQNRRNRKKVIPKVPQETESKKRNLRHTSPSTDREPAAKKQSMGSEVSTRKNPRRKIPKTPRLPRNVQEKDEEHLEEEVPEKTKNEGKSDKPGKPKKIPQKPKRILRNKKQESQTYPKEEKTEATNSEKPESIPENPMKTNTKEVPVKPVRNRRTKKPDAPEISEIQEIETDIGQKPDSTGIPEKSGRNLRLNKQKNMDASGKAEEKSKQIPEKPKRNLREKKAPERPEVPGKKGEDLTEKASAESLIGNSVLQVSLARIDEKPEVAGNSKRLQKSVLKPAKRQPSPPLEKPNKRVRLSSPVQDLFEEAPAQKPSFQKLIDFDDDMDEDIYNFRLSQPANPLLKKKEKPKKARVVRKNAGPGRKMENLMQQRALNIVSHSVSVQHNPNAFQKEKEAVQKKLVKGRQPVTIVDLDNYNGRPVRRVAAPLNPPVNKEKEINVTKSRTPPNIQRRLNMDFSSPENENSGIIPELTAPQPTNPGVNKKAPGKDSSNPEILPDPATNPKLPVNKVLAAKRGSIVFSPKVVSSPKIVKTPYRVNSDFNLPTTFYLSYNKDQLPSYSSDPIEKAISGGEESLQRRSKDSAGEGCSKWFDQRKSLENQENQEKSLENQENQVKSSVNQENSLDIQQKSLENQENFLKNQSNQENFLDNQENQQKSLENRENQENSLENQGNQDSLANREYQGNQEGDLNPSLPLNNSDMENIAPSCKTPAKSSARNMSPVRSPKRSPLKALAIPAMMEANLQSPLALYSYTGKRNEDIDQFDFDDLINESYVEDNANPVEKVTRSAIKEKLKGLRQYLPSKKKLQTSSSTSMFAPIILKDQLFKSPSKKEKDIRQMFSSTPNSNLDRVKPKFFAGESSKMSMVQEKPSEIAEVSQVEPEESGIDKEQESGIDQKQGDVSADIRLFDDPEDLERTTDPSVSFLFP